MMRDVPYSSSLLLLATIGGCVGIPDPVEVGVPKQFHERQIVVTLDDDSADRRAAITQSLVDDYGLTPKGQFPLDSIKVQCIVLQVPAEWSIDEELERLAKDRRVAAVQLNQVFKGMAAQHTDPYAKMLYGAQVLGVSAAHQWSTGRGIRIAVIDTGVNADHPDLRGRIVKTENFVDGGEASFATDKHGTAVAGVIAAVADDGIGIFGVAPDAELLAAKACWYSEGQTEHASCSSWTLAKALDYAIAQKVRVINMSLAGPDDALLDRLVTAAADHGISIVAATTDPKAANPGFPASHPQVIAVTASDTQNKIRPMGWHRDGLLAAPGEEILTTTPAQGYDFVSGSSLAAAHVSGAVALLLQSEPTLTPAQIAERLRSTAHMGTLTNSGEPTSTGVIDICAALGKSSPQIRCD